MTWSFLKAALVDASLSRGFLNHNLEFGIAHSRINNILKGLQVMQVLEQLDIGPSNVDHMLLDPDNGALLNHCHIGISPKSIHLNLVFERDKVRIEHIGTRVLVCSLGGLKIFPDVSEGLLGVSSIPLGSIFAGEVVVMVALPHPLEVHVVDIPLVDLGKIWMEVALDLVEQDKACQD